MSLERWEVRVGDEERHAVVEQLRVHLGAGRLTLDEFEERTGVALAARTVGDLEPLMADLPAVRARPSGPPVRQRQPNRGPDNAWDAIFRVHVAVWAVLVVFLVFVWMASGGGYFWPVWPALGLGLSVGIHAGVRTAVRR